MGSVKVLDDHVIRRIAAGEVIERPASVVKELLENSLDAGADSVRIRLKDAGKALIELEDNGDGMDPGDLEQIFQRHATSKITSSDDLFNIHSLGFRGEALYSIASIADITLQSRSPDGDTGWEIHLRGGQRLDLKPCAMNDHGTVIRVKELFFNTPARRKFLKSNISESHQIVNTVVPYALLYPGCRFKLSHEEKDVLDLRPRDSLRTRAAQTLNLNADHIVETEASFPDENLTIRLVLGDINIKRHRRDMQFIFVNGRPVDNKSISYNMNDIYRLTHFPGSFPFFTVIITLPANLVDVNVHPTKREVKIRNEQDLCRKLRALCERTLMEKTSGVRAGSAESSDPLSSVSRSLRHTHPRSGSDSRGHPREFETGLFHQSIANPARQDEYAFPNSSGPDTIKEVYIPDDARIPLAGESFYARFKEARYIGAFHNKYLLFEKDASLFCVDQHAAQERIVYEQLLEQIQKGPLEGQHLLTPVLISLTPQEWMIWENVSETLNAWGLETTRWDETTLAVHSHPNVLKDVEKAVRQLLAGDQLTLNDHDTIARRACRASVMSGDKLSPEEAIHQRDQLIACLDPHTCPHGRPTVIEMTEDFLDKQFLRV